jgi:hypothetical protein
MIELKQNVINSKISLSDRLTFWKTLPAVGQKTGSRNP